MIDLLMEKITGGLSEDSEHCALLAAKTFHKALRNYAVGKKK